MAIIVFQIRIRQQIMHCAFIKHFRGRVYSFCRLEKQKRTRNLPIFFSYIARHLVNVLQFQEIMWLTSQ